MRRYRAIVRTLFAVVFLGGGMSHIVQGRVAPESYGAFGDTALWPWLSELWESFVRPNIGWLTLALAAFEIAVGVCLLSSGIRVRVAVVAILAFFAFILILGYGFPTDTLAEDLLKNRVFTVVMAGLLIPVLTEPDPPGVAGAWRHGRRTRRR